jgi:hypothetical protein
LPFSASLSGTLLHLLKTVPKETTLPLVQGDARDHFPGASLEFPSIAADGKLVVEAELAEALSHRTPHWPDK